MLRGCFHTASKLIISDAALWGLRIRYLRPNLELGEARWCLLVKAWHRRLELRSERHFLELQQLVGFISTRNTRCAETYASLLCGQRRSWFRNQPPIFFAETLKEMLRNLVRPQRPHYVCYNSFIFEPDRFAISRPFHPGKLRRGDSRDQRSFAADHLSKARGSK
jgi:hypothetical protein